MLTFACVLVSWQLVIHCYEKAVKQSGEQFKGVSPVVDPSRFRRMLDGKENLPARQWFEAMPEDLARHFFLNLVIEAGFPTEIQTAATIQRRMEQAS